MKHVVQVRLQADADQLDVLARTLIACNETANLVSKVAHRNRAYRSRDLRAITYAQARQHAGLGAQVAQSCIKSPTPTEVCGRICATAATAQPELCAG
jgi:putative transposase